MDTPHVTDVATAELEDWGPLEEATGPEQQGPLQVVGAVPALPQQGRGRACAEHHHDAEGEQAQRGREEQVVLDRLSAGPPPRPRAQPAEQERRHPS